MSVIATVQEAEEDTRLIADTMTTQHSRQKLITAHHQARVHRDVATAHRPTEAKSQKVTVAIDTHHRLQLTQITNTMIGD